MLARTVQPEILDSLDAEDPAARRSRQDLRLINALMGNFRWVERQLRLKAGFTHVIELGAGEGRLVRRLSALGHQVTGIDLAPRPSDLPPHARWRQQDVLSHRSFQGTAVVATLFLHHFNSESLRQLGERLSEAQLLIFSEPSRSRVSLAGGFTLFPFVNHVTRHDMMISIRAGFRSGELRDLLGLNDRWKFRESTNLFGACRLTAQKI